MSKFRWNFPLKRKEDKGIAPIQKVFFVKDSNNVVPEIAESLVREAIQNSLDAHPENSEDPMHIRFALSSKLNSIPVNSFSKYLDGLKPHLESQGADIPKLPDWNKPVPFLTIEDFKTHGLRGDVTEDMAKDPKNDFCYFWRNLVGFTGKGGKERGKWGIGKAVYPASSLINTFFGATVRDPQEGVLIMGLSVLNLHQLEPESDDYYVPYGDFGVFDEKEENFVLPITDETVYEELKNLFNCKRSQDKGLSLMIPYPDDRITAENLALSAIQQYYYPILKDKMIVSICNGAKELVIDSGNLFYILDDLIINDPDAPNSDEWNSEIKNLKTICEFAEWATSAREEEFTFLKPFPPGNMPTWNMSLFEGIDLDKLRKRYNNGERIGLKIPLYVKQGDNVDKQCWFKVFLWYDVSYDGIFTEFIREDLTIPEINPDLRDKGIKALVVVDSDPNNENEALAQMIGLSENPAHTRWDRNADKFRKAGYQNADASLSFVINSLNRLCKRFLQEPMEDVDDTILADLFPIFEEDEKEPPVPPEPTDPEEGIPVPPEPIPPGKLKELILTKNRDGFRVVKNSLYEDKLRTLVVSAGYRPKRGNAIKKHRIEDFDFNSDISIMVKGLKEQEKEKNKVKYIITNQEFEVIMKGFDKNRDLEVLYTAFK